RETHGYNEGAVYVDAQLEEHPIFKGFSDKPIKVHNEKSPYATFKDYEGITLANIVVDEEDKGATIAYDFRSVNHMHMLMSSYAVNNMIGPDKGWTKDGAQLFLQAVKWARDGSQKLPEKPKWTVDGDIITNGEFELSGIAEYRSNVSILNGEE